MHIDLFQIDAFAEAAFTGNPAAVCPLQDWLPDELMQAIAAENNLSETAFLVRSSQSGASDTSSPGESAAAGSRPRYALRWFTPAVEVDLCGHATLASGHVVLNHLAPDASSVDFDTRSGLLGVAREIDGSLRMELPADPRPRVDPPAGLASILGAPPVEVLGGSTWIAVMADAETVTTLVPDTEAMSLPRPGLCQRHRTGPARIGLRLRLAVLRSGCGDRGGSRDRVGALRAHALLERASRAQSTTCPPGLSTWREPGLRTGR